MKKVLIVTYYFPPSGGPGVQRVLKFAKYLPEFGWHPVILTVEDGDYPARDPSLLKEIPESATIYRTRILEPYRLYRRLTGKAPDAPVDVENIPLKGKSSSITESVASWIRSTLFIPDARIGWYPFAVRRGLDIVKKEEIDAIYSSSPPYTTALIARSLHRSTKLPWIAGFRDPWTGFLSTPERWFLPRAIDRRCERSVFRDATAVEVAWKGIIEDVREKYPGLDFSRFHYLPNGFDRDDFPADARAENSEFTVTYTGSMYGKRNPKTFLQALEELVREGAVDQDRVRLRFAGRFGGEVKQMIRSSPLASVTEVLPYLPHSESIAELLRADALLLVVDEAERSNEIVPGKVFEYIGSGKPILALAPEGAIADLIRETSSGYVAGNQDIPAIKRAFLECYTNFADHAPRMSQNLASVRKYERREITRQLAALLDHAST